MKNYPVFGLVCAGGGAHGAYQVGVLKYIHEKFSAHGASPFQIFAGSSCGALNTSFFAAESHDAFKSRLWLEELWLSFHVPAYHGNILKNALRSIYKEWKKHPDDRDTAWAFLDPQPMHDVVQKGFTREHIEKAFQLGTTKGVGIAATEILSGRTCWFLEGPNASEWNLFHSIGILDKLQPKHLYASCSVPLFLPPVKLGNHYFLDGSVSLDRPLSAAISMGATRILSIATDKPFPTGLPAYKNNFRPRLSNVFRLILNRLSHDAARDEAIQLEMFNRFYRALSRKNRKAPESHIPLFHEQARPSHYHPAEVCLLFPSKRIRDVEEYAGESFLSSVPKKRTRFMFHTKFIRELIDLGYADAESRHHELHDFFTPTTTRKRWFLFARRNKEMNP